MEQSAFRLSGTTNAVGPSLRRVWRGPFTVEDHWHEFSHLFNGGSEGPGDGQRFRQTPSSSSFGSNALSSLGTLGVAAGINALGSIGGSLIQASATRYAADQGLTGTQYSADKSLEGQQYTADKNFQLGSMQLEQQYKMWDRDYQIADKLGLYHPSQLTGLGGPSATDTYKLGQRGFSRMPRAKASSIFTI